MLITAVISGIMSAGMCFLMVYLFAPVPFDRLSNSTGNAISGIISGVFSGAISTFVTSKKIQKSNKYSKV